MKEILFYLGSMLLMFLGYFIFVINNKRRLEKFSHNTYVNYLVGVYKLDIKRINIKQMAQAIAMVNSFIVATTVFVIGFINSLIIKLILGFIVLIPLQLFMYHIVGKTFQKKFRREK